MVIKAFSVAVTFLLFLSTTIDASQHRDINLDLTLSCGNQSVGQNVSSEGDSSKCTAQSFTFVEIERTPERIQLLKQCEFILNQRAHNRHFWDHSKVNADLCVDIWVRIEVQGVSQFESEHEITPHCVIKKFSIPKGRGGIKYRVKPEFYVDSHSLDNYLELVRCGCHHVHRRYGPLFRSQKDFFIHKLQDSEYIILVPNGELRTMLLKMVDYQDLNTPAKY